MFRILIAAFALCLVSAWTEPAFRSGVPIPDGRIVGGKDADIAQFPHQISMRYRGNHRCGGSIYTSNIVVSAAHCVVGLTSVANLTIVGGSTRLSQQVQVLPVLKFIIHEKYRSINNDYDVAILVLDGDFVFNENVKPISLARQRPEHGTEVTVTGWGTTSENGNLSLTLQQVNVNVVQNSECKKAYSITLTSRMLCAGVTGGGKDACQGDSGGPLIYNNELLGVVSWGTGCAREKYPGVYAGVPELADWIDTTAAAHAVGSLEFL